jgi:hypothetical protein
VVSNLIWLLSAAMILIGVILPDRPTSGLFGTPTAAVKTVLVVVGAGLMLYSTFGGRSRNPAGKAPADGAKTAEGSSKQSS